MKSYYLFILLLYNFCAIAQNGIKTPDSLEDKSYDELISRINDSKQDSILNLIYINTYIQKSKKENDPEHLMIGYRKALIHFKEEVALKYTDSIAKIAFSLGDDMLIGRLYIDKAIIYYTSKNYEKCLSNYLLADKYINEENDIYTQYKIKYGIANMKLYLGYFDEAISLFSECSEFYKNREGYNNSQGYLYSLRSLGRCYNQIKEYEKCTEINNLGIEKCIGKKYNLIKTYFVQSEGINQYGKKNYAKSIDLLKTSLPRIIENDDFLNVALNYMYLGKSYIKSEKEEIGIAHLQKVDSILQKHNYANLDLRQTYEDFINYYKKKGDLENQLLYTNRLLDADKILEKNYKDLISTIHKEYDTAELVASKNNLEKTLKRNKIVSYIIYGLGSIIILIITYMLIANYKKQKVYKQKYEELITKTSEREKQPEEPIQITKVATDELDINKDIVFKILKGLETFEHKEEYLGIGLTQSLLAEELDTNTTYLSKVINHYKGKNFNSYLNELRVNHAVSLLKNSPTHRRYTIKALAEELGFSNPRSFSDAFFSQTGIKPSYFIKQIEKEPDLLMSA
ncbi:helix-turn-helix domain-containing protein [Flavobacterium beibuense]|uniref:helix-turn-helix domain-containing protein n=1 Tax=Flavobacterium beibuense TaxID=657326 RepID=UPI003A8FE826